LPDSEHPYNRQILQAIASGGRVTQRSLSADLGVALGLTNLLIRRLAGKGYIKVSGMGTRHVRYLMTPAGWEALARATRLSLENTIHLYTQTREQIRVSLDDLSGQCEIDSDGKKRVVFYGAGDVAEITYVSLQRTDLTLLGVVDDRRTGRFFDLTISAPEQLSAETLGGVPYTRLIVTSVRYADAIRARIAARGVPDQRVFCL
jgi:DNA-binding MarR family transcriptional regulator